jgi:hypothetical protein
MKTPAWQRNEGKNPNGGLNAAGRASAKAEGHNLKPPAPDPKTKADAGRKASFCARMEGVVKNAKGPAERAKASLKNWNC